MVVRPDGSRQAIQVCADPSDPATRDRELRALADTDDTADQLLLTLFTEDQRDAAGQAIPVQPAWKWVLTDDVGQCD